MHSPKRAFWYNFQLTSLLLFDFIQTSGYVLAVDFGCFGDSRINTTGGPYTIWTNSIVLNENLVFCRTFSVVHEKIKKLTTGTIANTYWVNVVWGFEITRNFDFSHLSGLQALTVTDNVNYTTMWSLVYVVPSEVSRNAHIIWLSTLGNDVKVNNSLASDFRDC